MQLNSADAHHTGSLPEKNAVIEIPSNTWVIMDVDPPRLSKLVVAGRLDFADNKGDRKLNVDRMLVWGDFNIGSSSQPFQNNAEVVLRGIRTSDTLVASDQHFLGNKNLVIFGKMRAHGRVRSAAHRRTKLTTTAAKNATNITLDTSVETHWKVGDTIVITGTEYPKAINFRGRRPPSHA